MNWVIALLHVVGCEDIGHASQLMEKTVFESEKGCRSHDRSLWKNTPNHLLTSTLFKKKKKKSEIKKGAKPSDPYLCAIELGW